MTLNARQDLELGDRSDGLPLGEAVFRSLREALRSGIYRPGDRLREEEVAQRLQVSRTPVREAFGRLVSKGLMVPAQGRGLIVRRLDTTEVIELYAMREILEAAAARLAAQHASSVEIEALTDLEAGFEAASGDAREMARLNRLFHESIFAASRNRYLDSALQELQDAIALLGRTTFSVPGRPDPAAAEHRDIIAAIAARDPDRADEVARLHIHEALRSRLKIMQG
ncbi:MAG: GntR family transcriptional regulator [Beijerinckiaceae bacterium]|jgi:DNA-binding GntR family transcriptional regulator|nr:GntR family transcriptional regulator [Beijerinckiaceae bacterium]MDO9442657.1 GntR family transcriptional regulator [Beijerinckiaceae bacterium]